VTRVHNQGGARTAGPGKRMGQPPKAVKLEARSVMLLPETWAELEALGGKTSQHVRVAVLEYLERQGKPG
jgi:hypothetical protein